MLRCVFGYDLFQVLDCIAATRDIDLSHRARNWVIPRKGMIWKLWGARRWALGNALCDVWNGP
eukprot:8324300-Alexandrium_andersonii.AAC.1